MQFLFEGLPAEYYWETGKWSYSLEMFSPLQYIEIQSDFLRMKMKNCSLEEALCDNVTMWWCKTPPHSTIERLIDRGAHPVNKNTINANNYLTSYMKIVNDNGHRDIYRVQVLLFTTFLFESFFEQLV